MTKMYTVLTVVEDPDSHDEHDAAIANEAREFFAKVQREDADQMCKWAKVFGGLSYQIGEMRVFD